MNRKTIELDEYNILSYLDNKVHNVEPILELYRGKLYCNIIRFFINICSKTFGTKIFSVKKSYQRTLTNILSSWMFSLYSTYDYSKDYFLPNNYTNTSILYDILNDLCKFDTTIVDKEVHINKILSKLVEYYEIQLNTLETYKTCDLYLKNKNNFIISKNRIEQKGNNRIVIFYKFNINIKYNIRDKRLQNILDNILIPIHIYDKLYNNYSGPKSKIKYIDNYIWAIIYRYQLLGSNNHQLAVVPSIMNKLKQDYKLNFEFFASAINVISPRFCSIYYDIEKHFGSCGSFFNIIPIKGAFGFNPPYQTDIINNGLNKLLNFLDNSTNELTFIITIPIWDIKGKDEMQLLYNNELKRQNIDYGDFNIINTVKESKYFKECRMIPKEKFTYVDHNFLLFKNRTIQNTYVIILSNKNKVNSIADYDFFDFSVTNINHLSQN
jgi:hypothetical protein